jgi:rod shape-determining protein MreC
MRNLISFIINNGRWFLFILLELVSLYFVFRFNLYQNNVWVSIENSANETFGKVTGFTASLSDYFGLRALNEDLIDQNIRLEEQVRLLELRLEEYNSDNATFVAAGKDSLQIEQLIVAKARAVYSSTSHIDNYIRINKGANYGIKPDMGVIGQNGIVGIVRAVSPNYAIVQTLLNSKTKISCKVEGYNATGTLVWDGSDYRFASLENFPRHEHFAIGDTVVTSGYSSMFPEGIVVGTVNSSQSDGDNNFVLLKVKLTTNFAQLSNVVVINNPNSSELQELNNAFEQEN